MIFIEYMQIFAEKLSKKGYFFVLFLEIFLSILAINISNQDCYNLLMTKFIRSELTNHRLAIPKVYFLNSGYFLLGSSHILLYIIIVYYEIFF